MKLKSILSLLALAVATTAAAKDYKFETVSGDMTKTRIYTLDNGLKVYLSVNKDKPRIEAHIAVRTGSKNDPAETTGLAHYLEHLMFKGTNHFGTNNAEAEAPLLADIEARYERYRQLTDAMARKQAYHEIDSVSQIAARYFIPNEYDKLMSTIGAQGTNAYTSNDVTCYTEDIPSNEIDNWAKIQSDRFQNMVIRGFHTELEAVYEEYNIYLTDDNDKLWSAIGKKLTPTHPYGTQTTIGTQDHLKNPSITNIKNYFRKWYVPNNMAICMAGDFDPDQVVAIIDKYFGTMQPGQDVSQPIFPAQPVLTTPSDTTIVGQQAAFVCVAWRGEKAASLQSDTLDVISSMLSNGRAGLFDTNLNQPMKVMAAQAFCQTQQDYSSFVLYGVPRQGQTLEEVKDLMVAQLDNLKKGNIDDDLLPSIVNNLKRRYMQALDNNRWRVSEMVNSFVNGDSWQQHANSIARIEKMTKQDIVAFANRFFTNGYAVIYKTQGTDSLAKKIDKPAITPIPANRDMVSQFVKDIQNTEVTPIQPVFVDFKKDLTLSTTKKGIPVVYKKNTDNGLFYLGFAYDFGNQDDNRYDMASDYLNYVGTDKYSVAELKRKFYKLGCDYGIGVSGNRITIRLNGLSENMAEALSLMEDVLQNAKADQASYDQFVSLILKERDDDKKDQRNCAEHLYAYGVYGSRNIYTDMMSADQLRNTNPQELLDLIKGLRNMKHELYYYGPMELKDMTAVITKLHATPKKLQDVPHATPYQATQTPTNEVLMAPFDAKNIYFRMYHNEGRPFNLADAGKISVFNEYFGGGMNSIVFQEMREARGLAYSAGAVYTRPSKKSDKESFFANIITQNDKMGDCINQFHNILDTIPQSEAAFNIAKDAVIKRLASQRVTKSSVIDRYFSMRELGFDYDINETIYKDVQRVTLQDIVNFEKSQAAGKPYRYMILGNDKELDMKVLERIAPVKKLTLEDIFGY